MAKYRIVKINDRHYIQKEYLFGLGWKTLEYFQNKESAIDYLNHIRFKNTINYKPKNSELIMEVNDE